MAIEARDALGVVVVGPAGSGRRALERRLARLGHEVTAMDEAAPADLADADVVLVRPGREADSVTVPDSHPVIVVADETLDVVDALGGRRGGMVVLTGAETDGGYQVALRLCALMRPKDGRQ